MSNQDVNMMAHLMRRAGFGATRQQLEELAARPYEDVVEDLLNPERFPEVEEALMERYLGFDNVVGVYWIHRMLASPRQLEEKISLFWHHVFATARAKSEHIESQHRQLEWFRRVGLSDTRTILTALAKDPAMLFYLDNNENFKGEPNENFGRELLELFSMGVGNYTEDDVKHAALAFTGWTFEQPVPRDPCGNYDTEFRYNPEEHDDSEKTFLGETGRFNGEDIVDIIAKQPATAKFISRRLYDFFVADEPQVPAWNIEPPRNPAAIDAMVAAYFESGGEIRSILRVLFNSNFFKEAQYKKVKSPVELLVGVLKLVGTHELPEPEGTSYFYTAATMGQELMNPPSVESWHTGWEWIDGGALNERVNFAVDRVGDRTKAGVQAIIDRLAENGESLSPEEFVDRCLDLVGPVGAEGETRQVLLEFAESGGDLRFGAEAERQESAERTVRMAQLIVSSKEYQLA